MSLETWKQEHYPITAGQAAKFDDLQALDHCIKKWEGLTPEIMSLHGVSRTQYGDVQDNLLHVKDLDIDASTCALCWKYNMKGEDCEECLIKVHNNRRCTDRPLGAEESEFSAWRYGSNPIPMIALLKRTRELMTKENANPLSEYDCGFCGRDIGNDEEVGSINGCILCDSCMTEEAPRYKERFHISRAYGNYRSGKEGPEGQDTGLAPPSRRQS